MIIMYCRNNHYTVKDLCDSCEELFNYAIRKIGKCKYKIRNLVCSECMIHCFQNEKRNKIKKVMKYSGQKMIFRHPFLSLLYIKNKLISIVIKQTLFKNK